MVRRWLKDRREKKKEEARVNNAHLHAAVLVASTAAAVAAISASTAAAASSVRRNNEEMMKMGMAVAFAATLVAAQCVQAAEAMGANREHLASVISSAVNVRMHDDVTTLTAAAATALRGAATLKARAAKGERNIMVVAPAECGIDIGLCGRAATGNSHSSSNGEIAAAHGFLGVCIEDFLANATELLKRTRKVGVVDVISNSEQCRHFGLKTATRGVFEFECKNRLEYEIWTPGVARLLLAAAERKHVYSCWTCSQPKQY